MSKIRIAYLSVFHPFRGGIAQFNNELYLALQAHGEVKAFNFKRQYPSLLFPGKTQYVDEKDQKLGIEAEPLLDSINPISYFLTAKSINAFKPDVLITPYWMPFFAPALGKVIKQVKCTRKIALLHNVIPHEKRAFDHALNRYFLNQNDSFVVLSETVRKQLLHYLPNASYQEIPHPLYRHFGEKLNASEAKKYLGIRDSKKVILFFGFIRSYKGLDLLIQSLKEVKHDYTLLLAGESYSDYSETKQVLLSNGVVGENVSEHIQYISDSEVKWYFSAADICVLPYRSATQSGIAAVAKHFEVPLVVTPVGELPNEVSHLKNGFVCEGILPEQIAEGINNCLDHQQEYSEHQKGLNENNTFDQFAKKLIAFL